MKDIKVENTKIIPLRWIGNLCNSISTNHLTKAVDLDEQEKFGLRYKYHIKMWQIFDIPYVKWGTYYILDMKAWKIDLETQELLGRLGSDYDENGVAYWEKWEDEGGPVNDTEERLKYMEENGI
jgi:hypothetical protein